MACAAAGPTRSGSSRGTAGGAIVVGEGIVGRLEIVRREEEEGGGVVVVVVVVVDIGTDAGVGGGERTGLGIFPAADEGEADIDAFNVVNRFCSSIIDRFVRRAATLW